MNNKDMPAYPPSFAGTHPYGPAQPQEYTNEEIAADRFRDCMLECGGLTTWCKCRSEEAALAELERRG